MLRLYNSFNRQKEIFTPIDENHVRMYVCGPTVYDRIHVGNARPIVVFDTLFRLLSYLYPKVSYIRNITDVDDKIIHRAADLDIAINQLTEDTTAYFHQDITALNALPPTIEPKATEHIAEMIALVEQLISKGHAYAAEGHVLFHVPSMVDYGKLSRLDQDSIIAGARVEVATYKKDPKDFVLWKPAKDTEPGWDSPWGRGRPGWHLECSAMSEKYFGPRFDIHGGGLDLTFPHHENEIAQSCCAHGYSAKEGFARYWLHNGMLMIEGEKMSKSLGNFYTLHEILDEYHGEVVRLMLLSTHYRKPLDFSKATLNQAKEALDRFYTALRKVQHITVKADEADDVFLQALSDDLNTAEAISRLHELTAQLNKAPTEEEQAMLKSALLASGNILGLFTHDPEAWFKNQAESSLDAAAIEQLISARAEAKASKDFARADAIRDQLLKNGIILEDGPKGTQWRCER